MSGSVTDLPRIRLLKELYFNRTGLLFLLTVLLAIAMYTAASNAHGDARSFWLTLATGIAATSVYAVFAALLTTEQFYTLLRATVEQSVRDNVSTAKDELLDTIRNQSVAYMPAASYPASNSPDPAFNRDLNRSFMSSAGYTFQGVTARYNMARFASVDTRFDFVRIIVADPTKPDSVVTRARHAQHDVQGSVTDADLANIRVALIDDIWMSIVAAHGCWAKSDRIEFCFLADPPIDRVEIFDDDMFIARYSDRASWGFKFPAACRFLKGSMPYQMHAQDCARLFTSRYTVRLQIPRDDDPKSLFRALRKAGLEFDETQYDRLKNEFRDLTVNLPDEMIL
jgi:hypothetical protein